MRDEELNKAYFQYYETFENIIQKIKEPIAREKFREKIISYGLYGIIPKINGELEEMAWEIIKDLIDQQQHRREVNRANAAGAPKPEPKPSAARFVKPTVDEIAAYCKEKGYTINPQHFFNYYESNGWRVGKNPMKSWQAAVTSWNARDKSAGTAWSRGSSDSDTSGYEAIL